MEHNLPYDVSEIPEHREILKSYSSMILSVSGWRKIFARDGKEDSRCPDISSADAVLCSAAALVFSRFMKEHCPGASTLAVAADSRDTGEVISQYICRILLHEGWNIRLLGIAAVPEVIAYNMTTYENHGGIYISASHNPPGYNGLKFFISAGVVNSDESRRLISMFNEIIADAGTAGRIASMLSSVPAGKAASLKQSIPAFKAASAEAYRAFVGCTAAGGSENLCLQDDLYGQIRRGAAANPLGIILEFNGSARTLSIDRELLNSLDIPVISLNDAPGEIAHGILPEGKNLEPCRRALEKAYQEDPAFQLGCMFDNDGDRGSIVYIRERTATAHILESQQLFALAVLSELADLYNRGELIPGKTAVAVNGPTSLRVNVIAETFGAEVFHAEVGEAHVVGLADSLRRAGYLVRILGEGSNGGNITYPSVVRDPLNTLLSLIKLLTIRDAPSKPGLFRQWLALTENISSYTESYTIEDILDSLPHFTTTGIGDSRAVITVPGTDREDFVHRYEKILQTRWERDRELMHRQFGVVSWKAWTATGTECREGFFFPGGVKIIFYDGEHRASDWIWMRKSGTEPVFRVLADCRGKDPRREAWFLSWQRSLIQAAAAGEKDY